VLVVCVVGSNDRDDLRIGSSGEVRMRLADVGVGFSAMQSAVGSVRIIVQMQRRREEAQYDAEADESMCDPGCTHDGGSSTISKVVSSP
jgi:hypothetical protein